MNREKLMRSCAPDDIEFFESAAIRLEKVTGNVCSEAEGLALMGVLTLQRLQFTDDFVLNGDSHEENLLGTSDAAILVSCLCSNPDQEWPWWREEYVWKCAKYTVGEFREKYDSLLAKFSAHSVVASID